MTLVLTTFSPVPWDCALLPLQVLSWGLVALFLDLPPC